MPTPDERNRYCVDFPDEKSPRGFHRVDLTIWSGRPRMVRALLDYFRTETWSNTSGSRANKLKQLNYFRVFLDEAKPDVLALGDIGSDVLTAYVRRLDEQRANGTFLSGLTKSQRYNAVIGFLTFCLRSEEFGQSLDPELKYKRNPWPASHRKVRSRAALSREDLARVTDTCRDVVAVARQRLRVGADARHDPNIVIPELGDKSCTKFADMAVKLRALMKRHGDVPLRKATIRAIDPGLARAMTHPYGTAAEAAAHLYLTDASMVAFVILLTLETMFNPDTILRLKWSDIERTHFAFGSDRWTIYGEKLRSGRRQARSFSAKTMDEHAPVQLLKTLEESGEALRKQAAASVPHLRDSVFLHWQNRGEPICAYPIGTGSSAWAKDLAAFRERHRLPHFSLVTLRATAAELLDEVTGGDIKAKQRMLGHANLSTTERHYHSDRVKLLGREALAREIDLRERYAATGGRADPRDDDVEVIGRSAATPGFGCLDPLFSPREGQRRGRPCDDYGACPVCPQAFVNLGEPRSFRRLSLLRDRIAEASRTMHPARWIEVWQPRLDCLETEWLSKFDPPIVAAASKIELPKLPRIE